MLKQAISRRFGFMNQFRGTEIASVDSKNAFGMWDFISRSRTKPLQKVSSPIKLLNFQRGQTGSQKYNVSSNFWLLPVVDRPKKEMVFGINEESKKLMSAIR